MGAARGVNGSTMAQRLRGLLTEPSAAPVRDAPNRDGVANADASEVNKERVIGLIAAPWAAGISILICASLLSHDPAAPSSLHVSGSYYFGALAALLCLAVIMLATAWFRRRLLLGISMALWGLTVFNLHYWGFAVPYLLCAGWVLVRGYRAQSEHARPIDASQAMSAAPSASRRYTPPSSASGR
jgi:hypothetical protein